MRKRLLGTWVAVFVLVLATSLFAQEVGQKLTAESTVEQIIKRGVLRVGMSTFVPWAMKDKSGKLIGFEIDVAERLAKDMGVKIEFVPTQWSGIIPALLTGKFDTIISGMGITAERALKVNFTSPYDYTGMSIVANKKLAAGFKSLDDFNKPDVTIAVRMGATPVAAVKKFMPKAKMMQFDEQSQAYQELLNGHAYAVVGSAPLPLFQAMKYPDTLFMPIKETFTNEPIGFAVRKGDPDTLAYFNSWIIIVQAEGWLKEKKHYWFETQEWRPMIE
jgi:polar amino acid transport system substrate-binding protein